MRYRFFHSVPGSEVEALIDEYTSQRAWKVHTFGTYGPGLYFVLFEEL